MTENPRAVKRAILDTVTAATARRADARFGIEPVCR